MFAWSLAVFESCESEACRNLSMLNRCCLGMRSRTAGLDGRAMNAPSVRASTGSTGSWTIGGGSEVCRGSVNIVLAS
jgi:hypothetical protein